MASKEIAVIIPFYMGNDINDLDRCLTSIQTYKDDSVEVIVVSNGAAPTGDFLNLTFKFSWAEFVIRCSKMTSYNARNIGIGVISPEVRIVSFIDDDVIIDGEFFNELRNDFSNPNTMISGGKVIFSGETKVSFITANLAVKHSLLKTIQFNPKVYSGGDNAFVRACIENFGARCEYSFNRIVYHKPESFFTRFKKSLRYGSAQNFRKLRRSWAASVKNVFLELAKSIGFAYFCVVKKPLGKL